MTRAGSPIVRWCALVGAVGALVAGCSPQTKKGPRGPAVQRSGQSGLFDSVAENLDRLEQFDMAQMLPQICDRLNQWYQQEKPKSDWHEDAIVATLSSEVRALPQLRTLDVVQFQLTDAWYLHESVWLRDISKTARADQFEDVAVAERLFDWTVRNIQLDGQSREDQLKSHPHRIFEVLVLGHGEPLERAWVFMLLARQQNLDVVLLGLKDADGNTKPWLTALVSGEKLYLFDTRLGLPIPGPGGRGVATLDEVVADDSLLRRLDLDAEHPYPVTADDLKQVVALVEASPYALSRRMALVESRLGGRHKLVLTSPAGALVERLRKLPHVSDAGLWSRPFDLWLWQSKLTEEDARAALREMFVFDVAPGLMKGRVLYFKGILDGEEGAKRQLLSARPANIAIENYKLTGDLAKTIKQESRSQVEAIYILAMREGKADASYWLGLVAFEQKDYPTAIEFWNRFTLKDNPKGPWTAGARYNLGRTYEVTGDKAKAIAMYDSDTTSPQSHGNRLRARWLKDEPAAAAKSD